MNVGGILVGGGLLARDFNIPVKTIDVATTEF